MGYKLQVKDISDRMLDFVNKCKKYKKFLIKRVNGEVFSLDEFIDSTSGIIKLTPRCILNPKLNYSDYYFSISVYNEAMPKDKNKPLLKDTLHYLAEVEDIPFLHFKALPSKKIYDLLISNAEHFKTKVKVDYNRDAEVFISKYWEISNILVYK